ncbi:ATP-grasp fold amidoligase family protein [Tenacibaculum sp. Ill]|uniref:ATP-grasp fold amidoligase family protein n=1 Tax=Tenacibaculum sp. Ill TaxID=3445935 RepID=UPI003F79EAD5
MGYKLDLQKPLTLNSKIQWLKLNERSNLHTICADKYKVRNFIKKTLGEEYLIPLFFVTKDVNKITPENLPSTPFIIKTNHDSGTYFIVKDKSNQDWNEIKKALKSSLKNNYYYKGKEWQYKNIDPCIIVEKLLQTSEGTIPSDLKFHCFNGKVTFIQVDIDRKTNHRRSLFDINWNLLDFQIHYPKGGYVKKPDSLDKLIEFSEKISKNFTLARVDFYEVNNKIFFGEITFHPESGFGNISPIEWDYKLGDLLELPIENYGL